MKHLVMACALLALFMGKAWAQQENVGRPNVPGHLYIDYTLNHLLNTGSNTLLKTDILRGHSINVGYLYELPIGNTAFTFNPGVSYTFERYRFSNDVAFVYDENDSLLAEPALNVLPISVSAVRATSLSAHYVSVPVEVRWHLDKENKGGTFHVAVGVTTSYRLNSFSRLKYVENGETKTTRQYEDFQLNPIRFGPHMRIGYAWFELYGYLGLSDMWQRNGGPNAGNEAMPLRVGVSFDFF